MIWRDEFLDTQDHIQGQISGIKKYKSYGANGKEEGKAGNLYSHQATYSEPDALQETKPFIFSLSIFYVDLQTNMCINKKN